MTNRMKTPEEIAAEVFRRRDEYLLKRKKRRIIAAKYAAVFAVIVFIVSVIYGVHSVKPGRSHDTAIVYTDTNKPTEYDTLPGGDDPETTMTSFALTGVTCTDEGIVVEYTAPAYFSLSDASWWIINTDDDGASEAIIIERSYVRALGESEAGFGKVFINIDLLPGTYVIRCEVDGETAGTLFRK